MPDGDDSRGVKEYTPVFTSYAPVTLSKGVVGDNELLDWMLAACAGDAQRPHGRQSPPHHRRSSPWTRKGEPTVGWVLQGAMPIGYELAPMDGSRSEVLTESLTFAITGLERTAARRL